MDKISTPEHSFNKIGKINVVLGKNGCGKSTLLRHLDSHSKSSTEDIGLVKYISPERGGQLISTSGIQDAIQNDSQWGSVVRRKNHVDNFRQICMAEFRILETLVLRNIESNSEVRNSSFSFNDFVCQINKLLDNIKLVRSNKTGFEILSKTTTEARHPELLSSGESELISIAIEILSFCYQVETETNPNKSHLLLLDEPDVHLHPDLQARLIQLLVDSVRDKCITVFIATHSTAILGSLDPSLTHVCFMQSGAKNHNFVPVSEELTKIFPIFGAHPLSNVFNNKPILLVEGEDDERIWQQAIRSSAGRIKVWPCATGDIQSLHAHETIVSSIIGAVYEDARGYSLRDGDDCEGDITDLTNVIRFRLNCRSAENLILSDDVLEVLGKTWAFMQQAITNWIKNNGNHIKIETMKNFAKSFDRQKAHLKEIRLILMDLADSNLPWEVAVGKGIAKIPEKSNCSEGSLVHFLGEKLVETLGLK